MKFGQFPFYQKIQSIHQKYQKEMPWKSQLIRYEGLLKDKIDELTNDGSTTTEIAKLSLYLSEHAVPSTQIHYHHDDELRLRGILSFLKVRPPTLDDDDVALLFHLVQDAAVHVRRFYNFQLDKGVELAVASIRVAYIYLLPLMKYIQSHFEIKNLDWLLALIDHAIAQEIPEKSLEIIRQFYGTSSFSEDILFDAILLIAARQAGVIKRRPNTSVPIPYKDLSQSYLLLDWGKGIHWGSYPHSLSNSAPLPKKIEMGGFEYLNFEHIRERDHETIITLLHEDRVSGRIIFKIKSPIDDFNTTFMKICMDIVAPYLKGLIKGRGVETIVNLAEKDQVPREVEVTEEREEIVTRKEIISQPTAKADQGKQSFWEKIIFFIRKLLGKPPTTRKESSAYERITTEKVKRREKRKVKIPPFQTFLHLWAESFLIDAISNIHVELPVDVWKEGNYEIESVFVEDEGTVKDFKDNLEKSQLVQELLKHSENIRQLDANLFQLSTTSRQQDKLFLTKAIVQYQGEPYLLLLNPSNGKTVGILARSAFTAKWIDQHVKRVTLERQLKEFTRHLQVARFEDAVKRVFSDYL